MHLEWVCVACILVTTAGNLLCFRLGHLYSIDSEQTKREGQDIFKKIKGMLTDLFAVPDKPEKSKDASDEDDGNPFFN